MRTLEMNKFKRGMLSVNEQQMTATCMAKAYRCKQRSNKAICQIRIKHT
jgi:hypothetical protein